MRPGPVIEGCPILLSPAYGWMKAPLEMLASNFSIALAMIVIVNAWAMLDRAP